MLFFCTAVQQKRLWKEQVITPYSILNLAPWSVSAISVNYPLSQCTIPQLGDAASSRGTANPQGLNSHLTAHPTLSPAVIVSPNTLKHPALISFSAALQCADERLFAAPAVKLCSLGS